jgi:hypothetical protein
MIVTANGAGATYSLDVQMGGKRSDHSCNCRGSRDAIQSGGRGGARGQITVVTLKGARVTYSLEVEREGKRSEHGCACKGSRDDIQSGVGEGGQEIRSWL